VSSRKYWSTGVSPLGAVLLRLQVQIGNVALLHYNFPLIRYIQPGRAGFDAAPHVMTVCQLALLLAGSGSGR
jgi:hypothetical protein